MQFSTRTIYGLRALANLADKTEKGSGLVPLSRIAEEEKLSLSYLERLFAGLKKAGLVSSEKGKAGGYSLGRPAGEIDLYSIIKALENKKTPFYCVLENGKIKCDNKNCRARKALTVIDNSIKTSLEAVKLSDLI